VTPPVFDSDLRSSLREESPYVESFVPRAILLAPTGQHRECRRGLWDRAVDLPQLRNIALGLRNLSSVRPDVVRRFGFSGMLAVRARLRVLGIRESRWAGAAGPGNCCSIFGDLTQIRRAVTIITFVLL